LLFPVRRNGKKTFSHLICKLQANRNSLPTIIKNLFYFSQVTILTNILKTIILVEIVTKWGVDNITKGPNISLA